MFRLRRRDWIILTAFIVAVAIGYGVYSNWTEEGLRRTEADMKNNLPLRTATFCNVTTGANTSGYGARRVHIQQWDRIKRRICIERRWCHQSVDPTLQQRTSVQRTLQLTKQLMATPQTSHGPDARIAQASNC